MALSLSQTDNNHLATSPSREYFPLIHQGRINCGHTAERNPKWARLSQSKPECVRTGQRESQSEPDRTRVSQREQVWARLDQREREHALHTIHSNIAAVLSRNVKIQYFLSRKCCLHTVSRKNKKFVWRADSAVYSALYYTLSYLICSYFYVNGEIKKNLLHFLLEGIKVS